ncbi:MAG: class I SAM-dependent methyltransferase [Chloroflexota bacterium]
MTQTDIKPKRMSNVGFWLMVGTFAIVDLFKVVGKLVRKMPVREGMTVIDYGCGPGRYTIPVAKIVGPRGLVYAIDIQPLAIEVVERKAAKRGMSNVKGVLVDSYHTGLPDGVADLVLLIDTIQSIKDPPALFREIYRILKPDGRLFMDPGHLGYARARRMVENTVLFRMLETDGRNMVLGKVG